MAMTLEQRRKRDNEWQKRWRDKMKREKPEEFMRSRRAYYKKYFDNLKSDVGRYEEFRRKGQVYSLDRYYRIKRNPELYEELKRKTKLRLAAVMADPIKRAALLERQRFYHRKYNERQRAIKKGVKKIN